MIYWRNTVKFTSKSGSSNKGSADLQNGGETKIFWIFRDINVLMDDIKDLLQKTVLEGW